MNRRLSFIAILLPAPVVALVFPIVSNVTAAQRQDQSNLIDFHYDLAATVPCTVWFLVSADGGASNVSDLNEPKKPTASLKPTRSGNPFARHTANLIHSE
jgi:hypothetical protein